MTYICWVRFEWDPQKDKEAKALFASKVDFLEIYDAEHSDVEERLIASARLVAVSSWSSSRSGARTRPHHQRPLGEHARTSALRRVHGEGQMKSTRELTRGDFARALRRSQRDRIMRGELEPGDVAALRRFIGLSQAKFAEALGISVHTLRNWEQDRRTPEGPALALLRIAARHPSVVRENLRSAA